MNNVSVPKIRTKGFSGDWQKKTIGSISTSFSGGTPTSTDPSYYGGNIPFIRSGEIHSDKTELFLTEKGLRNSSAKMVQTGDLLLALYGATSGQIDISKINGAINQAILCLKTDQDKYFIKSLWEKHVDRILAVYLQGGQGNLSGELVNKLSFYFPPTIEEQNKISSIFKLIDEKISLSGKNLTVVPVLFVVPTFLSGESISPPFLNEIVYSAPSLLDVTIIHLESALTTEAPTP